MDNQTSKTVSQDQDFEAEEKESYWQQFRAIGGSWSQFCGFWPAHWQRLKGNTHVNFQGMPVSAGRTSSTNKKRQGQDRSLDNDGPSAATKAVRRGWLQGAD
jgi:hypothetical protein